MVDYVNNPPHYAKHSVVIEPIELCERMGFRMGNALKYCFRYKDKGTPVLDLQKAEFYVKREMEDSPTLVWQWDNDVDFLLSLFEPKHQFISALRCDGMEGLLRWIRKTIEQEKREASDGGA